MGRRATWRIFGWWIVSQGLLLTNQQHTVGGALVWAPAADSRLTRRVTVVEHDKSALGLLAELTVKTGVNLFVDPSVRGDRLTVTAHNRSLRDVLGAIAAIGHFHWRETGHGIHANYTLFQTRQEAAVQAMVRLETVGRTFDSLQTEVEVFKALGPLAGSAAAAEADKLTAQAYSQPPGAARHLLLVKAAVARLQITPNPWRSVLYQALNSLGSSLLTQILKSGYRTFQWPSRVGVVGLPPAAVQAALAIPGPVDGSGGRLQGVLLRLTGVEGAVPHLDWHLDVVRLIGFRYMNTSIGGTLPTLRADAATSEPVTSQPEVAATPPYDRAVRVQPTVYADPGYDPLALAVDYTLGQAIVDLDKSVPFDCVADAFYSDTSTTSAASELTLGKALVALCKASGHRWSNDNGFALIRSTSYEADRAREPSAADVERWKSKFRGGGLTIDDYAEMAGLDSDRLSTLEQMALARTFPPCIGAVAANRMGLQLWSRLTAHQRELAQNAGLPVRTLAPGARSMLGLAVGQVAPSLAAAVPAHAGTLHIGVTQFAAWGVRGSASESSLPDRVMAAEQLRAVVPHLRPDQLVKVLSRNYQITLETPQQSVVIMAVTMMPVWRDAPLERTH